MPPSEPTIRAGILARFDVFLASRKARLQPLLLQAGLRPADVRDPDRQLSLNTVAGLLEAAAHKVCDPCLGLHFARSLPAGASGILGHAVMSAPTVRDALASLDRYASLFISPMSVSFTEKAGRGSLAWKYPETFSAPKLQFSGLATGVLLSRLQEGAGLDLRPQMVELAHGPFACPLEVRQVLGARVRFNRPTNLLVFDANTLNRRMAGVQPGLHALVRELGDRLLEEQRHASDIVEQTRRQIASRLRNGASRLQVVAAAFGIPPRALQRRLKRSGSTFESLLDATRRDLAAGYLRDTGLSMTEIAMLLGFSELSAFTRAAQRWFGVSPRVFRSRSRDG